MFLHNFFYLHIFSTKRFSLQKGGKERIVGKERKVGDIGQIRAIRNEGITGIVRKVSNSFK